MATTRRVASHWLPRTARRTGAAAAANRAVIGTANGAPCREFFRLFSNLGNRESPSYRSAIADRRGSISHLVRLVVNCRGSVPFFSVRKRFKDSASRAMLYEKRKKKKKNYERQMALTLCECGVSDGRTILTMLQIHSREYLPESMR